MMLVVSKSRPEINLRNAIAHHEFSVVPRSLFAVDGTMLHCSTKSVLMKIAEDLSLKEATQFETSHQITNSTSVRAVIYDAMAQLKSPDKPV